MPELPEVEIVRQGLDRVTLNQKIEGGDVLLSRTIAYPFTVGEFLAGLDGVTIRSWRRRGKYLLAQLRGSDDGDGGWLGVHLRMTGQLLWLNREEPLQKHTRVRLFFPKGEELRFVDQRTFGKMWWVPPSEKLEDIITGIKGLAPEPFAPEFSIDYLAGKLKKSQRAIKTAILDQSIVAGVGNIYADEALFLSRISPETLGSVLNLDQIQRLHHAIIQVLQAGIEAGGTTFSHFMNVQGINGNYGGVAWVYRRTGEPCRVCETPIQRVKLGGRSSHFCPNCQMVKSLDS
ncbi:MAG TPA: DNA-formamidopyrimidine glycosylase [Cyanobacteria bacterium UBA11149]|nr:DNA-formamidopyrimidine glycosylase [Cyanobacteria bacterium UBA11367]HBE59233.1 DNA-formamidopyrimidine glycosylase [Cyanobacteria bacterium UBA11366]HBK62942.1 DNA-formamidopyrimidine glycosylase [Cyanobacteria bacterium UBA11166]HBR76877.1 DNA-formamidopyrimidine glycosylase [Cyanobacteria bacterium UBA11159]HBS69124.1 DNA-formamidopyrimidine glycosylase [Cyanobacteria bacterium UBA11153]HBW88259.1 DNA-formamidopyrimidine glycosylase [Cyanobacteria bacterium UBA11149]